jgi:LysR family glycine cleavage system transcriptional activator
MPRLGRFTAAHPDIELQIETSGRLVDLDREGIDIALRHGLGDYPGLSAIRFLTPRLVPVCSPGLLRQARQRGWPSIRQPLDCLAYPLLQDSNRVDWSLWLQSHGIDDARSKAGASYEGDLLLIQAALVGQGIALVRDIFVASELASGRLVQVLDLPWPNKFAYYLVARPEAFRKRKIALFRDWLLGEVAAENPGDIAGQVRLTVATATTKGGR